MASGSNDSDDQGALPSLAPSELQTEHGQRATPGTGDDEVEEGADNDEDDDDDDEEEEEEEPILKYASLTRGQGTVYRNGDSVSAFLVAGDKMVIGTHNGRIHVLALPSFQSLQAYHAHSASVSSISISPSPPPLPSAKPEAVSRIVTEKSASKVRASSAQTSGRGGKQPTPVANTPSNFIHVATSSIDGNVCVFSLVDPRDTLLRNFSRPVQCVALSPDYKNDRTYLSGGLAGNLVLTVGGRAGASANANTSGAAAAAAGWLNTIGIGGNNGTDTILHSGEGSISTIKWSSSGRHVVWVNEKGIKIMRSNLHLGNNESDFAWKRMGHIDRPTRHNWDDMAGLWKARVEWIDEGGLEKNETGEPLFGGHRGDVMEQVDTRSTSPVSQSLKPEFTSRRERLVVGWGDFVWIVDIHPGGTGVGKDVGERKIGRVDIVTKLRTDCIVSGVSLYTPTLLVVLAYTTPDSNQHTGESSHSTPSRGIRKRQNALQPEIRIIDVNTKEEVCVADTLTVSRFESLSATDYHLGVLPVLRGPAKTETYRRPLELIGGMGGSIWDAAMYPARLLSSAASVRSSGSASERATGSLTSASEAGTGNYVPGQGPHPALLTRSLKIFIQSPYDCVLATKPTLSDHLCWLDEHGKYEAAWNLLDSHPESAGVLSDRTSGNSTPTIANTANDTQSSQAQNSLAEFLADDNSQTATSNEHNQDSLVNKEKRRVGEKWLQQLVNSGEWNVAGRTCGQVLDKASSWEYWIWVFAEADKFEDISPFIPAQQLRPPISSTVYEVVLGHYIAENRLGLAEFLDKWQFDLFHVPSVVSAIESKLNVGDIHEGSAEHGEVGRDWRILTNSLAKLYLADGRARDALRCYIKLQDADTALALITSHHLIDAVADDIPGLILLRVNKAQQKNASLSGLEEASLEPIRLLVAEAHQGIVKPESVMKQLGAHKDMRAFQYLYLRALWNGDTMDATQREPTRRSRFDVVTNPFAVEGRSLVNDCADAALSLFADFDRDLLFEFLRSSQSYTLSTATFICEKRHLIPELVYLLAKEGQTKRALRTIIDRLGDVSGAISFAKEQDDPDLWNDLLNYSMNKPVFIKALLEGIGTAINPITLVRRIPEGLEIVGLRDALTRMIKEYELQYSISEGVMRVLRGEVASGMNRLRSGQKKGIRFDIDMDQELAKSHGRNFRASSRRSIKLKDFKAGHCSGCGEILSEGGSDPLVSFPCLHAMHLSCYLIYNSSPTSPPRCESPLSADRTDKDPARFTTFPSVEDPMEGSNPDDFSGGTDYGIGSKVKFASNLRNTGKLKPVVGCPLDVHQHRDSGHF